MTTSRTIPTALWFTTQFTERFFVYLILFWHNSFMVYHKIATIDSYKEDKNIKSYGTTKPLIPDFQNKIDTHTPQL